MSQPALSDRNILSCFHAGPSTSTRQYCDTEFNGNTLNYMVEYLFIIYTANFYASCNFKLVWGFIFSFPRENNKFIFIIIGFLHSWQEG